MGAVPPRGRPPHRARTSARHVDREPVALGAVRLVVRRAAPRARRDGGSHRARPPLARLVRPGHDDRPRLVDGAHLGPGQGGARGGRSGRGRARRRAGARAARRRRAGVLSGSVCSAPARPRPDDDGLEGARVVPGGSRADAVRPERQRRPDGVVGRDGSSAAGPSARTERSSTGCSRTSAPTRRRRSRPRPAAWRPGWATSGSHRASRPRSSASWWGRATRRAGDSRGSSRRDAVRAAEPTARSCGPRSGTPSGICPAEGGDPSGGIPLLRDPAREQVQPRKISFAITRRWICEVPS